MEQTTRRLVEGELKMKQTKRRLVEKACELHAKIEEYKKNIDKAQKSLALLESVILNDVDLDPLLHHEGIASTDGLCVKASVDGCNLVFYPDAIRGYSINQELSEEQQEVINSIG